MYVPGAQRMEGVRERKKVRERTGSCIFRVGVWEI